MHTSKTRVRAPGLYQIGCTSLPAIRGCGTGSTKPEMKAPPTGQTGKRSISENAGPWVATADTQARRERLNSFYCWNGQMRKQDWVLCPQHYGTQMLYVCLFISSCDRFPYEDPVRKAKIMYLFQEVKFKKVMGTQYIEIIYKLKPQVQTCLNYMLCLPCYLANCIFKKQVICG